MCPCDCDHTVYFGFKSYQNIPAITFATIKFLFVMQHKSRCVFEYDFRSLLASTVQNIFREDLMWKKRFYLRVVAPINTGCLKRTQRKHEKPPKIDFQKGVTYTGLHAVQIWFLWIFFAGIS